MIPRLGEKEAFGYFRMGLVTGIVDKQVVVDWADQEIQSNPVPGWEIIELSLSGHLPYSQMIRLLSSFQGEPDYGLPLKLLFARAGIALDEDPGRAAAIIMGLRLLNEEEYLPKEIRSQLIDLDHCLESYRDKLVSGEALVDLLAGFLEPYKIFRYLFR